MAKFSPGNKFGQGRVPGSQNQRTKDVQRLLDERGFNPIEAYLEIIDEATKQYKKADPFDHHASALFLKLLLETTKEIASHSLPKIKSSEVSKDNPLDGMSASEKLEIVKEYQVMLEHEAGEANESE